MRGVARELPLGREALVQSRDHIVERRAATRELGGDVDDGELVTLRQVSAQGRSRAVVGGAGVPVSTLADLIGEFATIHGQSGQIRLSNPDRQRELLDEHARSHGLTPSAMLEVYVSEPGPDVDPTTLRTDLYLLVG